MTTKTVEELIDALYEPLAPDMPPEDLVMIDQHIEKYKLPPMTLRKDRPADRSNIWYFMQQRSLTIRAIEEMYPDLPQIIQLYIDTIIDNNHTWLPMWRWTTPLNTVVELETELIKTLGGVQGLKARLREVGVWLHLSDIIPYVTEQTGLVGKYTQSGNGYVTKTHTIIMEAVGRLDQGLRYGKKGWGPTQFMHIPPYHERRGSNAWLQPLIDDLKETEGV